MDFIPQKKSSENNPLLSLKNISKSFGNVSVLSTIEFKAYSGEIIAWVGENGAGKSTLMKILSGVWPKNSYEGTFYIQGKEASFFSTLDAQKNGIAIIHQELHLIPELSIAENIFLGLEPNRFGIIQWKSLYQKTKILLEALEIPLDPKTKIKNLSLGEQQLIEIAKAIRNDVQILILDEPTSALTEKEIRKLFSFLRKLKLNGTLCLYVSHKLNEVFDISDRIFVLRDGKLISEKITSQTSPSQIVKDMVGRDISDFYPPRNASFQETILEISSLSCFKESKKILNDISFYVQKGEVLGFAGLMGSGRSELIHTLFGATSFKIQGKIFLDHKEISFSSPRKAIHAGMALLTEDRKFSGIIPLQSVQANMTLAALKKLSYGKVIDQNQETQMVKHFIQQFKIKTLHPDTTIAHLSGGNQQKVLLARWLLTKPKVLFLDEPTRGVDVGAKVEIYQLINQLAQEGVAMVLVSSDLPEVLKMSDRICILNQGCLAGILSQKQATPEKIMQLATCHPGAIL